MTGATSGLEQAAVPAARPPRPPVEQVLDEARIHGAAAVLRRAGLAAGLMKDLAECLMQAELQHHLRQPASQDAIKPGNYRNGSTPKTVTTDVGKIELAVPRLRFSTFVPQLVPRYQRRIPGFDHSILLLYARGVPEHVLRARLLGLYGPFAWAELGRSLVDALAPHVGRWQARRIDTACALVYCDTLPTPAPLLFALAVQADGGKDVLGFWAGNAGWAEVLGGLRQRGLLAPAVIAGDAALGQAAALVYPGARCEAI